MNRQTPQRERVGFDEGSIELIVLGLLAALIVVLAIPLLSGGERTTPAQTETTTQTGQTAPAKPK